MCMGGGYSMPPPPPPPPPPPAPPPPTETAKKLETQEPIKAKSGSEGVRIKARGRGGLRIDNEQTRVARGYNIPTDN